ncbi:2Fe-2S iron-sulfur cluster-binding protein, partial [Streptomyces anulatus]
ASYVYTTPAQERLHPQRSPPGIAVAGHDGEVTFSVSGKTVHADGATPLLDIGEGAGVLMPSGCRMGICFGCVTPLKAGAVRDLRTGEITEAEPGVLIQTCVSAAAGPCDIER